MDMRELVAKLEGLLRLRSIPFGMKLYETVAEMEVIPKIRRPKESVHTLDQIVAERMVSSCRRSRRCSIFAPMMERRLLSVWCA